MELIAVNAVVRQYCCDVGLVSENRVSFYRAPAHWRAVLI